MVSDRKLFLILVLLALYIFGVRPISQEIPVKKMELRNLRKSIAKERFIEKKSVEIKKIFPEELKKAYKNKELLFSSSISISSAMSSMQETINDIARKCNVTIISINWGEAGDGNGYLRLPITFVAKGKPSSISSFVLMVLNYKKLFKFLAFSVSKYNKDLSVTATVEGFKLKSKGKVKK